VPPAVDTAIADASIMPNRTMKKLLPPPLIEIASAGLPARACPGQKLLAGSNRVIVLAE